jgi:hypothetical protein
MNQQVQLQLRKRATKLNFMKTILLYCLVFLTVPVCSQCNQRDAFLPLDKNAFKCVDAYKDMPNSIKKYLDNLCEGKFSFKQRQIFKTSFDKPRRVLSFIVKVDWGYIIHYEHLGRGIHVHSLLIKFDKVRGIDICNLITPKFSSTEDLIVYLQYNLGKLETIDHL